LLSKTAKRMPTMIFWWNNSLSKGKFQKSIKIFSYFSSFILTNWFFIWISKFLLFHELPIKLLICILWFLWRIFDYFWND
jgi:hypothetical protein